MTLDGDGGIDTTRVLSAIALAGVLVASLALQVSASCNVIPAATPTFRGARANIDRPFARPGDWVTLTLDPACHGAGPGFDAAEDGLIVTVVFTPPAGPRNVVALATDCTAVDVDSCSARGDVETATCVEINRLGQPVGLQRLQPSALRFRFPDTDGRVRASADDITLSGPASIAVTRVGDPLPCALASASCAAVPDLRACVDALYARDGSCAPNLDGTFAHFTALPPPNDFQALCTDPSPPCTGLDDDLRFTIDTAGNLLLPMDWRGILVDDDAIPVARLLRGSTPIEAFPGRGVAIDVPDLAALGSYSPAGVKLPPLFDPQHDASTNGTVSFFGSADAPETVLRIARHDRPHDQCVGGTSADLPCVDGAACPGGACAAPRCVAGSNAGLDCSGDRECPQSECGPGIFDFTSRLADRVGPIVVRRNACVGGAQPFGVCQDSSSCPGGQCGTFAAAALDPVPLDGLNQSSSLNAFVTEEAITEQDVNGDGDATDHVVKLNNRFTGSLYPIGDGGSVGRAVARIRQPPFSFPALALEDGVLAYLEPEPSQGNLDLNGNGDVFDTLLSVFRVTGGSLVSSVPDLQRIADGALAIGNRPVVVSNGLVFFRSPEASRARQRTTRVSVAADGTQALGRSFDVVLSANGRYVAFADDAPNLVPGDTNSKYDVFVRDLETNAVERVSIGPNGEQFPDISIGPAISADGRFVAFQNFDGGYSEYVRDRVAQTTESIGAFGSVSGISNDGRYTVRQGFDRVAERADVYRHDRFTGQAELVSVSSSGLVANHHSLFPAMSADGRFVAFGSYADNLVDDDTNGGPNGWDVFRRDVRAGTTQRVSVDSDGNQSVGLVSGGFVGISADGNVVVFDFGGNLVPGDTNGDLDVFSHDVRTGITERISVDSDGRQGNNGSFQGVTAGDGRFVTFLSQASNLVAGDTNGARDLFLRDRLVGTTKRISIGNAGEQQDALSMDIGNVLSAMSADGRTVAFVSQADNLVAGDTALCTAGFNEDQLINCSDVFVRAADSQDLAADRFPDGRLDDTVLEVFDPESGLDTPLCPATQAAVAAGAVVFLRPESSIGTTACPGGSLNASDDDVADEVVQLWSGSGSVSNLGVAATGVALSAEWIGALISEEGEGRSDLNGDGDVDDDVVQVRRVDAGPWTNVGHAADAFDLKGSVLAFLTPEVADGTDLNHDGDRNDRVLEVFEANAGTRLEVGAAAEELVLGDDGGLVAFRTLEASQGNQDLNGDGDTADGVLQIYDTVAKRLLDTRQAVTPCRLEACDPRLPYRVLKDTVRFLTFEIDQGQDLNGDGDLGDLVLQFLNVRQIEHQGPAVASRHTLAAVTAGICTTTGRACATDRTCAGGTCFVPPGGCNRDVGVPCDPAEPGSCPSGTFCQPSLGQLGQGTCHEALGPCRATADCQALDPAATCNASAQRFRRITSPLLDQGGAAVVTGVGRCIEDFGTSCTSSHECARGEFCEDGTCHREHGVCRTDADCTPGALCEQDAVVQTVADVDRDEVPDVFDNCPGIANVAQADADGDGIGDVCSAAPSCSSDADCDDGSCTRGCVGGACVSRFAEAVPSCHEQLVEADSSATDCRVAWFTGGAARQANHHLCIDNDVRCDADPTVGRCSIRLAACLSSEDPTGVCSAGAVQRVTLRSPRTITRDEVDAANAGRVLTALGNLGGERGSGRAAAIVSYPGPAVDAERCSELIDFEIPLRKGRKATKRLRTEAFGPATASDMSPDRDHLALTCLPCAAAKKLSCRVEEGRPVVVLPDVCGRRVLDDVADQPQTLTCGEGPSACTQQHAVRITKRRTDNGTLDAFEVILDPRADAAGKLHGRKCRTRGLGED